MEKKVKDTIIVISLGLLVIFLISNRSGLENTSRNWLLYSAIALGFIGFTSPWLSRIIHRAWFWIGDKMGFVVSKIVLGLLFIIFVIPFGMLSRLFRKDLMFMKGSKSSTFIDRTHLYGSGDFDNPW